MPEAPTILLVVSTMDHLSLPRKLLIPRIQCLGRGTDPVGASHWVIDMLGPHAIRCRRRPASGIWTLHVSSSIDRMIAANFRFLARIVDRSPMARYRRAATARTQAQCEPESALRTALSPLDSETNGAVDPERARD